MGIGGIVSGAANAARKAVTEGAQKVTQGAQKVAEGAKKVAEGAQQATSTAVNQTRDTFESAKNATTTAVKKVGEVTEAGASKVVNATDKAADAVKRVTPQAVKNVAGKAADLHQNVSNAIDSKLGAGAKKALDVAGRAAGAVGAAADLATGNPKAALTVPATIAGEVVSKAGPSAAKAASRFVPGANVAAAGMDAYQFAKTMKDPSANTTDKVLSGITAAGSALGATNIPVVSQIGSAVGTAADIANIFFGTQD